MEKMMQYALYYFDSCPYCQRVLKVLPELKVKVEKTQRQRRTQMAPKKEKLDATGFKPSALPENYRQPRPGAVVV